MLFRSIAQFESLALEATYDLNAKPTLSLFTSKLPFRMIDHVYKVARSQDFQQWAEAVRQYHQDNTAVQNIRGIYKDNPKKQSLQKKGFTAQELAKILGVKMLSCDPNAMDMSVGRSRSFKPKTQGCAANIVKAQQSLSMLDMSSPRDSVGASCYSTTCKTSKWSPTLR